MRKLATAAAVSLALASGGAFGLGLGDIEMRSALNQPMDAEIRLTSVKPGELDGMIVKLASADAFARAGIERSSVLTDLRFEVDQSGPAPVIRIVSQRPVVEPFLNFLLEVDWPQGRMVREYTVLLDPPVFMTPSASERNSAADQPALVQRGDEALVVPTPIERAPLEADAGEVVGLDDLEIEIAPDVADEGEVVSLDVLGDDALLSGSGQPLRAEEGEVISLTDLEAPNTAALEERGRAAVQAFDPDSIEVEIVGSTVEVGDDVVIQPETTVAESPADVAEDGSTIVSLDNLLGGETGTAGSPASVTVNRGDTLFEIARANVQPGVSVQQMMMAILAANESSFINNNINLVRAGATLQVPDAQAAQQLTQTQALAAIGQQNQLWREYRDQLRGSAETRVADASGSGSSAQGQSSASAGQSDSTSIDTASLDSTVVDEANALSEEARAILENARNEILNREELKIVADNSPTGSTGSATTGESDDSGTQRLGELNNQLQLAREELSSTRLRADELSDQEGELQSTTENLDALISLRQNEVARLEAQLEKAREAAALADESEATKLAQSAFDEGVSEAKDAVQDAGDAAGDTLNEAGDSIGELAGLTGDALDNAAEQAGSEAAGVMSNAGDAVEQGAQELADTGSNALSEAGETLGQVELFEEETAEPATDTERVVPPSQQNSTWLQEFMSDPKRMMIAGIGGVGLLGVLGTLLFRRRRREDDSLLDFEDDVEFLDDQAADELQAEVNASKDDGLDLGKAGLAAGGAAAAGVAAASLDADDSQASDNTLDDSRDDSLQLGSEQLSADDTLDKDDTISEVDVYLAYGLHGQAEELLTKAIERNPNNPQYAEKLLETYHAQGNKDGFRDVAENYHARFGGTSNPAWSGIAVMGAELIPGDSLFVTTPGAVAADAASDTTLSSDEELLLGAEHIVPSDSTDGADDSTVDELVAMQSETSVHDQSLDPAFAFDEGDLEATGDFSQIANELAAEADSDLDYPGLDSTSDREDDLPAAAVQDATAKADDLMDEAMTLNELDGVADSTDDFSLDLDQLSDELELDSAELLNSETELGDLEIPDLTANNELLADDAGATDNADEMDTMLDLAKAYIDMGDKDSASSALDEIVKSGSPEQVSEAETLLRNIS